MINPQRGVQLTVPNIRIEEIVNSLAVPISLKEIPSFVLLMEGAEDVLLLDVPGELEVVPISVLLMVVEHVAMLMDAQR